MPVLEVDVVGTTQLARGLVLDVGRLLQGVGGATHATLGRRRLSLGTAIVFYSIARWEVEPQWLSLRARGRSFLKMRPLYRLTGHIASASAQKSGHSVAIPTLALRVCRLRFLLHGFRQAT